MEEYNDHGKCEFGGDGEDLSYLFQGRDNFAIPITKRNDEGVDFYFLQC
jgi:hypothetical protein